MATRTVPPFELEDDDLAGIETKITAAPAPARGIAAITPATATEVDEDGEVDLVADHDELKAKPSLTSVLPKEANKVNRFALVKGFKAFAKPTHFLASAGAKGMTVLCVGEGCPECARGGDHGSRRKIVALAILYTTDTNGKFVAGTTKPGITIGFISLSPTAYSELSDCPSEGEDIYSVDFKATKKSNGIGWNYGRMSHPTTYVRAGIESEVAELAAQVDPKVLKARLGKTVSLLELKAMVSGVPLSSLDTAASLADIEDLNV